MLKHTVETFHYAIGPGKGRMAYRQWSQAGPSKPWLICAHGLNQNSRHLEPLASRLAQDFNILAPDFPGRGLSDYLVDKLSHSYLFYVPLMQSLWPDWKGQMGGLKLRARSGSRALLFCLRIADPWAMSFRKPAFLRI